MKQQKARTNFFNGYPKLRGEICCLSPTKHSLDHGKSLENDFEIRNGYMKQKEQLE
jgi:hypothetical protein